MTYQNQAAQRANNAKQNARDRASKIARHVAGHLQQIKPAVEKLAAELSSGRLTGKPLMQHLRQIYDEHRDAWRLLEIGVAYEPEHNPLGPGQVYAPHFGLKGGVEQTFDVSQAYDYRTSVWFQQTKENGAYWIDPYFGGATQRWTAGYAAPFYQTPDSRVFAGVVRMNFDLDKIRALVAEAVNSFLDETLVLRAGYVFLLSAENKIIAHPNKRYIGKTLSQLRETDGTLQAIMGMLDHVSGGVNDGIVDPLTEESYWIFTEDIAATDWKAVVVFNKRHTREPAKTVRVLQRTISATVVVFLCSAAFLLLGAYRGSKESLWRFSIVAFLLLFAGTVATWVFAVTGAFHSSQNGVYIVDTATAEATIVRHLMLTKSDANRVLRIPTGVFVQSLTFTSANNVRLTGYIWQRKLITPDDHEGKKHLGFIFPEAEQLDRQLAYENNDVIGWYFETILRQQFDYSRYPFDRENVWIRLWPESLNPTVILMPDFASYREKTIAGIPGVEKNLVLEGWTIKNSYFSFRTNSYNVDFGQPGFHAKRSLELYFNIGLRRNFVSPFVSYVIPVIVVAFMAFSILITLTRQEDIINLYGFSASAVLGYCGALFFVLIVAHVHLRNTLSTPGIIYMEYFYFVLYLAILAVSTDSLLFASSRNFGFIHYKDNMIVKQLYWPVLAGLLFVITLIVFS